MLRGALVIMDRMSLGDTTAQMSSAVTGALNSCVQKASSVGDSS